MMARHFQVPQAGDGRVGILVRDIHQGIARRLRLRIDEIHQHSLIFAGNAGVSLIEEIRQVRNEEGCFPWPQSP
jgi:hypothetical protein